jgi:hypothetical protein
METNDFFHCYKLATSNVDKVLDGDINQFISAYLRWNKGIEQEKQ